MICNFMIFSESVGSGASISEAYAPIRKLRERAGAEIILPANNEELETAITGMNGLP